MQAAKISTLFKRSMIAPPDAFAETARIALGAFTNGETPSNAK
jgi:hypothetical protein